LPHERIGAPRVEVENGICRIHLAKLPTQTVAKA
jgi:hypothetical protein